MGKRRIDTLLVERGLAESREKAQTLVLAGRVRVGADTIAKPGTLVPEEGTLALEPGPTFVSRGGVKLACALERFGLAVAGWVALDVGAATGGFTDCLLQRGAARVYAVDVGHGLLDYRLRSDPRVVIWERTNARNLPLLPEVVDLVTVDVSFISLRKVVPAVLPSLKAEGWLLPLIKPQFEVGRGQVGKGGVVRDPSLHRAVLVSLLAWMEEQGLVLAGLVPSPLLGPAGNREFFALLSRRGPGTSIAQAVEDALAELLPGRKLR